MALAERDTLRREQVIHANSTPVTGLLRQILGALRPSRHPHLRALDARQLRDIGLTPADVEELTHRLPSQHAHHPRG